MQIAGCRAEHREQCAFPYRVVTIFSQVGAFDTIYMWASHTHVTVVATGTATDRRIYTGIRYSTVL
jgi:hypothetical protein